MSGLSHDVLVEVIIHSDNLSPALLGPQLLETAYSIEPRRCIQLLIANKRYDLLQQLESMYKISYTPDDFLHAVEHGSIEFVRRFIRNDRVKPATNNPSVLPLAGKSGSVEMAEYIIQNFETTDAQLQDAVIEATKYGNLEMIKYLIQKMSQECFDDVSFKERVLHVMGDSGNLEVVQYIVELFNLARDEDGQWLPAGAIREMIIHGHYNVLQWLMDEGYILDGETLYENEGITYTFYDIAYATGREDIMKLFEEYDGGHRESPEESLFVAIMVGNVDVIEELFDEYSDDIPIDISPLIEANNLGAIKTLYHHEVVMSVDDLKYAIEFGAYDVVEWLLDLLDLSTEQLVELLKYAIEQERVQAVLLITSKIPSSEELIPVLNAVIGRCSVFVVDHLLKIIGLSNVDLDELSQNATDGNNVAVVLYLSTV